MFMVPSQVRVLPLVVMMSERRCPRSGCCFAWGRTVCGTGCRRCSPSVTSSERIAGAWVFRSHRSASSVMGSSRLTILQLSLGLKMVTSSMLRRCFEEEEEEEEDDDDHDEFDGTVSRFPEGFLPMRMCRWFPSGNYWKNKFSFFFGKYHLFCIESFRVDFRCVHRLQLLKVCDRYVTLPNSPRV